MDTWNTDFLTFLCETRSLGTVGTLILFTYILSRAREAGSSLRPRTTGGGFEGVLRGWVHDGKND